MWLTIFQNIIISILVIFLAHHLILHLKDSYTIKKTKDLTEMQGKKYKTILEEVYMINEKEKKELLQKIEETKSQQVEKKEEVVQEEIIKNGLSETELKLMNDDLDNFIKNDLNIS
jgi:predicted Holliday junction resolvase-like endonuclease